ncbi:poly(A) polymerase I [Cellvibrio zantedeschiae]|uniref:Poly(A) polymerase I n=2 Tax=Cellvibrio zantedeschiae TaxID=1237077 RepID=A0ABQ3B9S1_9GAMM|nr:poly(A) polymerase I [Cellvibrio zantedeschiae]
MDIMLKRLINLFSSRPVEPKSGSLTVIPRDQHNISRKNISPAAIKIIKQLEEAGFTAYLVGGGVRDLLLGGHPKDFDIATDAKPEEIKRVFRSARIIGRRFQIVHVRFGREVFEVTTFRGHHEDVAHAKSKTEEGMLLRDNVYGTIETDAARRDFTVNALYYTTRDFSVHDYCNGLEDIKNRTLRIIGDPATRYKEDPVRMLRAVRFAAKLGFKIEPNTAKPIRELGSLLNNVPEARLFEEVLKLFLNGSATATFTLLREYDLLKQLFPGADTAIKAGDELGAALIERSMINTDKRIRAEKTVTPAFIYAALLWPALQHEQKLLEGKMPPQAAYLEACQNVISRQLARTSIPKRFLIPMREIWDLQARLPGRQGMRALRLLDHPRFRAAYDFLLMREDAGEKLNGLGSWWTAFQSADDEQREQMVKDLGKQNTTSRPRRRRPRKPAGAASAE